ncbi:hypothetical protein GCM10023185_02660 [Hymenobacter saemangeumensis]|uniref:Lipocalin-like domain-containing protein n=1 Tax=Hymenobacter saemangeumensis TaxID=1084522 RepID=A0ABP8HYG4_9BACT
MKAFLQTRPLLAAALLLATTSLLGCEKEKARPTSKADILTAHKWQVTSWRLTTRTYMTSTGPGSQQPTVLTSDPQSCDLDDVDTYNADGTLLTDYGTIKCQTSDPQTVNGTWQLLNNEAQLSYVFRIGQPPREFTINQLSHTLLDITESKVTTRNGYTYEYEYTAQYRAR